MCHHVKHLVVLFEGYPWEWRGVTREGCEIHILYRWNALKISVDGCNIMTHYTNDFHSFDDLVTLTKDILCFDDVKVVNKSPLPDIDALS
jgi:hypothetical protein